MRWAVGGMTVLTNDGTLPLATNSRIALIGVPARETLLMGGGSAEVSSTASGFDRRGPDQRASR